MNAQRSTPRSIPTMADVTSVLKDAAYITIGFGVLAVQKAQVRRQELTKQLGELSSTVEDRLKLVEERLQGLSDQVESSVDAVLDDLEARLPDQAREPFVAARKAAKEASGQFRNLVLVRDRAS